MATSIKRIIAMLILMDILIASVMIFNSATSPETLVETELRAKIGDTQNRNDEYGIYYPQKNPDTAQIQFEKQFGDQEYAQKSFWEVITGGVTNPYNDGEIQTECTEAGCNSTVQKWMVFGFWLIIIFIHLFGILEAFYLAYSKKFD